MSSPPVWWVGRPDRNQEALCAALREEGVEVRRFEASEELPLGPSPKLLIVSLRGEECARVGRLLLSPKVSRARRIVFVCRTDEVARKFCATADIDEVAFAPVSVGEVLARMALVLSRSSERLGRVDTRGLSRKVCVARVKRARPSPSTVSSSVVAAPLRRSSLSPQAWKRQIIARLAAEARQRTEVRNRALLLAIAGVIALLAVSGVIGRAVNDGDVEGERIEGGVVGGGDTE